ncbi:hypothetical protein L7F22_049686 [Adiantum nelumboides]|nr:hypothetical protein [Adiantum nelumboides]
MLIAAKKSSIVDALKEQLKSAFSMKDLGATEHVLGVRIRRQRDQRILYLSQERYIEQLTFDKAKKHKKRVRFAKVPSSSSSSSDSSSDLSEEDRKGKKRSKKQRHRKGKKKARRSKSRRVDDSSTEDTSTNSSDSEDGHFYANKKNFYKANQYDFLEDKSKKVRKVDDIYILHTLDKGKEKQGLESGEIPQDSARKEPQIVEQSQREAQVGASQKREKQNEDNQRPDSPQFSFMKDLDDIVPEQDMNLEPEREEAKNEGNFKERSKLRHVSMYLKGTASSWWLTQILEGKKPKDWSAFQEAFYSQFLPPDFEQEVRKEWDRLSQWEDESVPQYVDRFWDVLLKVTLFKKIEDSEKMRKFEAGLHDGLHKAMKLYPRSNLPTLIESARIADSIHHKGTPRKIEQSSYHTKQKSLGFQP